MRAKGTAMDGGADGTGRREDTLMELSEKIGQAPELTVGLTKERLSLLETKSDRVRR